MKIRRCNRPYFVLLLSVLLGVREYLSLWCLKLKYLGCPGLGGYILSGSTLARPRFLVCLVWSLSSRQGEVARPMASLLTTILAVNWTDCITSLVIPIEAYNDVSSSPHFNSYYCVSSMRAISDAMQREGETRFYEDCRTLAFVWTICARHKDVFLV